MSLMIVSIFLILGLSFTPFLNDDFFPTYPYTIIGYVSYVFSNINTFSTDYNFVSIVHASVLLSIFIALVSLSLIFIPLSIIKLVFSSKKKQFVNLSKYVVILYLIFLILYVYFINFVLSSEKKQIDGLGSGPICILVLIPFFLAFNIATSFIASNKKNPIQIIIKSFVITCSFVFILVPVFQLGGLRFGITASYYEEGYATSKLITNVLTVNNPDLTTYLAKFTNNMYSQGIPLIIPAIVMAAISFAFELVILVLLGSAMLNSFSSGNGLKGNFVGGIVLSSIAFVLAIVNIILCSFTNAQLNKVSSLSAYGGDITSKMQIGQPIVITVFSLLLIMVFLAGLLLIKQDGESNV